MLLLYNIADLSCTCGAGEGRGFLKAHRTATANVNQLFEGWASKLIGYWYSWNQSAVP